LIPWYGGLIFVLFLIIANLLVLIKSLAEKCFDSMEIGCEDRFRPCYKLKKLKHEKAISELFQYIYSFISNCSDLSTFHCTTQNLQYAWKVKGW